MRLKGVAGWNLIALLPIIFLGLFCGGCGDYFRPVANPTLQPGGDTQRQAHVVVTSRNSGLTCVSPLAGGAINIDVSGDSNVATFTLGQDPVNFASLAGALHVFAADQGDDTFASYSVASFTDTTLATLKANTTGLPSVPAFVAAAGSTVFITEPTLNQVAVIDATTNAVTGQIPVGRNPVGLVATPDGTKVYSLNQDDDTLTVIFTANRTTPATVPLPPGSKPIWGVPSADGMQVYVVNQGTNNVSVIDTTSDTIVNTFPVGAGPSYAVFQASQKRLYVLSPASTSLSIIDVTAGTVLTQSLAAPSICNAGNLIPKGVTALADGSRAYVADQLADQSTNSICVLNTTNNTFVKTIPVGTGPIAITSDPDSTRVYTANTESTFGIASISRSGTPIANSPNVYTVTVNTSSSTSFAKGQVVTIFGVSDCSFNGQATITSVDSSTQFEYQQVLAQPLPAASAGGTVSNADVSLIQTVTDTPVMNNNVTPPVPLTIPVPGTPTYISITP